MKNYIDHVGRFILLTSDLDTEETTEMMQFFHVIDIDKIPFPDGYEIVAYSPLFRKRRIGEFLPRYSVWRKKDGEIRVDEVK